MSKNQDDLTKNKRVFFITSNTLREGSSFQYTLHNSRAMRNLLAGDKVSGYLGFEVPKNKETLKFIVDESIIVEMANPVYEASEEE